MEPIFDTKLVEARREHAIKGSGDAGFLLDIAATEMAERLSAVERHFETAVELHGATGAAGRLAMATGRITHLRRLETSTTFAGTGDDFITAGLEELPLAAESANLILSPLALHLVNDLPGMMIRIRRALKPDGLFLAAIPGAGTLAELRDSLLAAEVELYGGASPRVIPFADLRDIGALLQRARFALPVVDSETHVVRYDTMFALMRDLRDMGMANALAGRSRRPARKALFLRAAEIYAERHADADGRIRASFCFVHASGWAPHESQRKPLARGSATVSLAAALARKS